MKYEELINDLRHYSNVSITAAVGELVGDAADAIEALETEIRESMQKCAECGDANMPKRGEWILKERAHYFKCSICKEPIPYKFGYGGNRYYNYCPRCGAKMEVQDADTDKKDSRDVRFIW